MQSSGQFMCSPIIGHMHMLQALVVEASTRFVESRQAYVYYTN